ncbi:MAG: riboflavin synthase [Pirellulales bacterium]|nr:riboflavin synthase [Pirellulales bacterium]
MFTGLVGCIADVKGIVPDGAAIRLELTDVGPAHSVAVGDSIAINGCCLTVVQVEQGSLFFEAGAETLRRTTLGDLGTGDCVNIEMSLQAGDALGGHLVSGHIDGVGTIDQRTDDAQWSTFWVRVPPGLTRQMASKGSIAVDGVSLTLVDVEDERFSVALIPHTLQETTLGKRQIGDRLNLETDILAKYVQRQMECRGEEQAVRSKQ